jgi:hypothetical protein
LETTNHLIVFPLRTFGQASKSKGPFFGFDFMTINQGRTRGPKEHLKGTFSLFHRRNPISSSVFTSFLAKSIPTCTSKSKGTKAYPLFSSNPSNTMNQIMRTNPKLVFNCFKAFEIMSQAIISWSRYANRFDFFEMILVSQRNFNICSQCTSQT